MFRLKSRWVYVTTACVGVVVVFAAAKTYFWYLRYRCERHTFAHGTVVYDLASDTGTAFPPRELVDLANLHNPRDLYVYTERWPLLAHMHTVMLHRRVDSANNPTLVLVNAECRKTGTALQVSLMHSTIVLPSGQTSSIREAGIDSLEFNDRASVKLWPGQPDGMNAAAYQLPIDVDGVRYVARFELQGTGPHGVAAKLISITPPLPPRCNWF